MTLQKRPTVAHTDLEALAYNYRASKQFIGAELKYMAVVKANAYGHGAVACSLRLEAEGVDWFGVALPEEGVELRRAGVTRPILCLGSFWPGQENLLAEYELTPVVYQLSSATGLNKYVAETGQSLDIHVKIDTGMGRVGIGFRDAANFAKSLKELTGLRVTGLLTHLAAAEDPDQADFTDLQIARFEKACSEFRSAGHDPELIDLANSPGAIAHPNSRGNMVRLGGSLYGLLDDILPPHTVGPELKPVLSLRSRIAYLRHVPSGESLGYGRTFTTKRPSLIALLPIGYADGYPRGLSNKGIASVNGTPAPIVGRISMDWTLLDVTDLNAVAVNDEVFLIGNGVTAAEVARAVDTIGYEITCGISARVERSYK